MIDKTNKQLFEQSVNAGIKKFFGVVLGLLGLSVWIVVSWLLGVPLFLFGCWLCYNGGLEDFDYQRKAGIIVNGSLR